MPDASEGVSPLQLACTVTPRGKIDHPYIERASGTTEEQRRPGDGQAAKALAAEAAAAAEQQSLQCYHKAAKLDTASATAQTSWGTWLLRVEGDAEGALKRLSAALQADPTNLVARCNRAAAHKRLGALTAAKHDLERAVKLHTLEGRQPALAASNLACLWLEEDWATGLSLLRKLHGQLLSADDGEVAEGAAEEEEQLRAPLARSTAPSSPYVSLASPLYLPTWASASTAPSSPYISPTSPHTSPLHLPYISPTSPLYLPYISQYLSGCSSRARRGSPASLWRRRTCARPRACCTTGCRSSRARTTPRPRAASTASSSSPMGRPG